jgi:hypothetical protein
MSRQSLTTRMRKAFLSLLILASLVVQSEVSAASNEVGSLTFHCRNRILELLSLPAEGRFDTGQLVSFDRSLRKELKDVVVKRTFTLEMMSAELDIHLFPSRLRRMKERESLDDLIGFDAKGLYVQLVSSADAVPRSSFARRYLQGPNYNPDYQVQVISLPNLFKIDQESSNHLKDYIARFGSNRSGDEVMGYLLLHEWIHAQQSRRTSWGFYLDQYSHIQSMRPDKSAPIRSRIQKFGRLAAINLSGHKRLAAGAHLLNEFQAQSIVPLPGFSPKESRDLWMKILKHLTSGRPDWKLIRDSLERFQHILKMNRTYSEESRLELLSPVALESAIEWLWKTKHFYGSKRFKKVAKLSALRGTPSNQGSAPSE